MSDVRGKIRPATASDFDRVYPLLRQLNDTRMTRDVWQRLFQPLWRGTDFCPGYLIEDGDRIGGFIGTLYSERRLAGELCRLCNLTSWIVLPEYRHQSVMLLLPLLRDKSVTLTSLTSSHEAYAVYRKLGFVDLDAAARVIYRFPSPASRAYRVACGERVLDRLGEGSQRIYRDHADFDLAHCVVEGHGGQCYLVLERKRGRAHVHYIDDPDWFRAHVAGFRYALLSALGMKTLQVDERFLQGRRIVMSRRKLFKQAKQYRSQQLAPGAIDALYSELTVLATLPAADS